MKAIYSNRMVDLEDFCLDITNRGFLYGDGLFETIMFKDGKIKFLERHLDRLHRGMKALGMIPNKDINFTNIENQVPQLVKVNNISHHARVKLQVWRKSGGLFTPLNNETDYLIIVQEQLSGSAIKLEADISQEVKINYSQFSRFKTCNMLPYILAGLEKEKRKIDELIILNGHGFVAECSAANIFWVKDGTYFTPSLESGCIEGIKRAVILEELNRRNIQYKEILEGPDSLYNADFAFASNVAGIFPLAKVGSITFNYQLESFLYDL